MQKPQEVMEFLLKVFFEYQIQIKMFHFQTKTYAGHKSSDEYLQKVNDKFDKFMEVAQGIFGKFTIANINIKATMMNDNNIIEHVDSFIHILKKTSGCYKDKSDLMNIRDDIIGDANQFKYLLTFN